MLLDLRVKCTLGLCLYLFLSLLQKLRETYRTSKILEFFGAHVGYLTHLPVI